MASLVEVRDPYTAGHQQRVAKLATAIARELSLSEERIEGIGVAGTLHDIGKISIPAEILSKPGRLRKSEFDLVKDHAEIGYSLLKAIEFSRPVAQIVLQHHERTDGSGYPNGLSGKNILIEARIMGVADVIESMSSHRPYRPAFSIDKALLEIILKKGVLYDPEVVDACVRLFNEKGFVFD
jgi:putative nucleotidyltransferase with HDIG domain